MLNDLHQIRFVDTLRALGAPIVTATIVETEGSTYRKAGATMLISGDGASCGLVSGGCFEGDLEHHARTVVESSASGRFVEYDLRDEHEIAWGLGLGCNGRVRLWLEAHRPPDFGVLGATRQFIDDRRSGWLVRAIGEGPPAWALYVGDDVAAHGPEGLQPEWLARLRSAARALEPGILEIDGRDLLVERIRPPLQLLLLGAGPDAIPLLEIARTLGWETTTCDHRPAFAERSTADRVITVPAKEVGQSVDLDGFDACVVMSHHFFTDGDYLDVLADCRIPYIGLLGPRGRRERLLAEWPGERQAELEARLFSPVGLPLGGDGPESIALAIAAEIQRHRADALKQIAQAENPQSHHGEADEGVKTREQHF